MRTVDIALVCSLGGLESESVSVHPVGFEPTPPKRLGLKSNAFLARRERRQTNSATDTERPPRDQSHSGKCKTTPTGLEPATPRFEV